MKLITKSGLVAVSSMFILGLTLPSFAQALDEAQSQGPDEAQSQGMEKKSDERMQKMVDELGLTAEQKEAIKQHRSQNIEKVKAQRLRLQQARKLLKEELDKPNSDVVRIKGLAAEIKEVQGQIVDMRISQVLELKKILTPEQYQLLQEKIKEKVKERVGMRFKAMKERQCQ